MPRYPKNVYEVAKELKNKYKDFSHNNKKRPLDELLFIICSVKTNEANYQRSYLALRKALPQYKMLHTAPLDQIARIIHKGGLSSQKAKSIKRLINILVENFSKPTLSPLRRMNDEECETFLLSLPGIGKKVARCVMMYSLNREVFPVDTHCWRISRRLGWIRPTRPDKSCRSKEMDRLQSRIPPELRFSLHVNFVSLGRQVCFTKKPLCSICIISKYCRKIGVQAN